MSEALVIRPDAPNPINRLPNLRSGQKVLGHLTPQMQLNRLRRGPGAASLSAVPPVAYTVIAHSDESPTYKTVPPGCILVIPASSGNSVSARVALRNNLKLLDAANRKYVLDPLNNKKAIYKLFGPVTIFTEGELYPDFSYSLISYYNDLELDDNMGGVGKYSLFETSGLIRILPELSESQLISRLKNEYKVLETVLDGQALPGANGMIINDLALKTPLLLVDGRDLNLKKIKAADPDHIAEIFKNTPTKLHPRAEKLIRALNLPQLFKFSNVPEVVTQASLNLQIEEDLAAYKNVRPRPNSVNMDVNDYIKYFLAEDYLDFTQEELFEKAGPGVYYNFNCREKAAGASNPFKLAASNLQRISEAATHRKGFLHNVFSGAARKTRRRLKIKH